MDILILKARTGKGLGQPEWSYRKYSVENLSDASILAAKRLFTRELGTDLDRIEVVEVRKDA